VLNFYRRHEATVTHRSVRDDSQAHESLYVKARVLETYPVSARAVVASLARSIFEYNDLSARHDLNRPPFTENHALDEPLARLRSLVASRLECPSSLRVLLVLSDVGRTDETRAWIELANNLAREHTVFLCNAQPHLVDQGTKDHLSPRVIFVEGNTGPTPWSLADDRLADQKIRRSARRPMVLAELMRILCIDVVHSHSPAADRLMLAARSKPPVPWMIHAKSVVHAFTATTQDPDSRQLAASIFNEARGFFYEDASELELLEQFAPSSVQDKPRWILEPGKPAPELAASCAEAYLQVRSLLAFPRETDPARSASATIATASRKRA
jgi:hypothetical protein